MSVKCGMRNSGSGIAARGGAAARSAAGRTQRVKFEAIAINSVAKKKPTAEDAAHYIGLEHIDPGCFVVSRWGGDVAPIGDKLLMKKGDVLFGRRRAYQRKVAIAPFDGIFSAHGMVLRPKTDVVDEKFFPFFIASDQFMNEAIRISVGGLSPTINWGTLKNCEFDLPPMDEQKKLAELLWAANDLKESYKKAITATDEMLKAKFREYISGVDVEVRPFGELSESLDGRRIPVKSGDRKAGVYPYYGASGVVDYVDSYIFDEEILLVSEDGANLTARTTPIAFSVSGKCWVNNHAHVVKFQEKATQKFVEHYIELTDISPYITGTAQPKLNKEKLNRIPIPLPPLSFQREFVAIADKAESAKANLKKSIAAIDQVMKGLVNG